MTYDSNNIFAKILKGDIPSHKIYEDDKTYAFLDVMPRSDGHTLVIPKADAMGLLDAHVEVIANCMATIQKLAPKIVEAMGADGFLIQQFNGEAAGQTVFHLHFHIVPRKHGVSLRPHAGEMADPQTLASHAEAIRAVL
jgi:histidine triad (HIT) family protein